MRTHIFIFLLLSTCSFSSCQNQDKEESARQDDHVATVFPEKNSKVTENPTPEVANADTNQKPKATLTSNNNAPKEIKKTSQPISKLSQHESARKKLMASLDQTLMIEYLAPDYSSIAEDTAIQAKDGLFEISYNTSCLNDSLVAQEMYDYGGTNAKSYLISHNYSTEISIKVDGILTGNKTIRKELFLDLLDKEFLERSILKHPQFVRFDKASNEAVFEFIVGIPNTDWLVLAGINLGKQGQIRVIDVMTPGL